MSYLNKDREAVPAQIHANLDRTIGQTVREWREFRGYRLIDLQGAIVPPPIITTSYLSQLERGLIKNLNDENLIAIARGLNISPGHLLLRIVPSEADLKNLPNEVRVSGRADEATLEALFKSGSRIELLKLFFSKPNVELHVRELVRRTGLEINLTRRELENLEKVRILQSSWDANKRIYSLGDNPIVATALPLLFGRKSQEEIVEVDVLSNNLGLGERIREQRKSLGWDIKTLVERSGGAPINNSTISAIETGRTRWSRHLPAIARALDLPIESLLSS